MTAAGALSVLGLVITLALVIALGLRARAKEKATSSSDQLPSILKKRAPLTVRERVMFHRIQEAASTGIVLAQVSFSALLESDFKDRNRFDRKYADFVLCTRDFDVIAVIELDDSSHGGRASSDAKREELLTLAGYTVVRWRDMPKVEEIRAKLREVIKTRPDAR